MLGLRPDRMEVTVNKKAMMVQWHPINLKSMFVENLSLTPLKDLTNSLFRIHSQLHQVLVVRWFWRRSDLVVRSCLWVNFKRSNYLAFFFVVHATACAVHLFKPRFYGHFGEGACCIYCFLFGGFQKQKILFLFLLGVKVLATGTLNDALFWHSAFVL